MLPSEGLSFPAARSRLASSMVAMIVGVLVVVSLAADVWLSMLDHQSDVFNAVTLIAVAGSTVTLRL